jgi:hypothetical protein
MLYPVELPVHSEESDTMSLAINKVNVFEGLDPSNAKPWFDCWIQGAMLVVAETFMHQGNTLTR